MYLMKEELIMISKKFRLKYFQERLGLSYAFCSKIMNGKEICSEVIAKAILSICFDISFTNEDIENKLSQYFIKTKE